MLQSSARVPRVVILSTTAMTHFTIPNALYAHSAIQTSMKLRNVRDPLILYAIPAVYAIQASSYPSLVQNIQM